MSGSVGGLLATRPGAAAPPTHVTNLGLVIRFYLPGLDRPEVMVGRGHNLGGLHLGDLSLYDIIWGSLGARLPLRSPHCSACSPIIQSEIDIFNKPGTHGQASNGIQDHFADG